MRPAATVVWLLAVLAACAPGRPGGHAVFRLAVDQLFEQAEVVPHHQYYYIGSDYLPDAIIAVDEGFTLVSSRWTPVRMTPELLAEWVENIGNEYSMFCEYRGAELLAPDGRRIGYFYSKWDPNRIVMLGGNQVNVFPPDKMLLSPASACGQWEILDDR